MSKIIILANSWRPGGRCIAGINPTTGNWHRPVSKNNQDAIPLYYAQNINLLDVAEIPFTGVRPNPTTKYQTENEHVSSFNWSIVGKVSYNAAKKYCQNSGVILHSSIDTVQPSTMNKLAQKDWRSLQLVETEVTFNSAYRKTQWWANFLDGLGNPLVLKVKDPIAIGKLNNGVNLDGKCLLTVSLAQPWEPPDKHLPLLCYKLVVGVIKQ